MSRWIEMDHIDGLPVRGTTLDDLDLDRVAQHLQHARHVRIQEPMAYLTNQQGVTQVDGEWLPTMGGLLCFGKSPQRHLPYTGIALTRYTGVTPNSQQVIDIRDLRGTLFEIIDQADAYLWAQSNHGFRLNTGPRRIPVDQYPRTAIRELIVNAIAHRDYRVTGSRVKIEMFKNEIEWQSPGGLPPGITVENILKSQYTRNPIIVGFLWDAGFIEQRGMGLNTVVTILTEEKLPYPQMEDTGTSFLIKIEGHGAVDKHFELGLSEPLAQIYTLIESTGAMGIGAKTLAARSAIPLRTVNHRLRELMDRGLIKRVGSTNMTRYLITEPDA